MNNHMVVVVVAAVAITLQKPRPIGYRTQYLDRYASENKAEWLLTSPIRCFRYTRFTIDQFYELLAKLSVIAVVNS